jgi:hypothetical protein
MCVHVPKKISVDATVGAPLWRTPPPPPRGGRGGAAAAGRVVKPANYYGSAALIPYPRDPILLHHQINIPPVRSHK